MRGSIETGPGEQLVEGFFAGASGYFVEHDGQLLADAFRDDPFEPTAIEFIGRSPLLLPATADAEGRPDISPKGDEPGFVAVEDDHTLVIPDRTGNRMILGLRNVPENPHVAMIFLVPGTGRNTRACTARGR